MPAPINLGDLQARIANLNHADRLRLAADFMDEHPELAECLAAIVVHELRMARVGRAVETMPTEGGE
jgi:hypothetical protein